MATIQKRETGAGVRYRVMVRLRGHPAQHATFERLTDARRWAQLTESAIREGRHFKVPEGRRRTLSDAIDRYKSEVLPGSGDQANRACQLEWWRSELGHLYLVDVAPARIAEARDKLLRSPPRGVSSKARARVQPATVVRYLAALSHMMTVAEREWLWIESNPVRKVSKPREPRGRVRFLSNDERVRLLDACRQSSNWALHPIVVLALSTGMRSGELLKLTWDEVDLARGWIVIGRTKNGDARGVPLAGEAARVLRELAASKVRRMDTRLVFPGSRKPHVPATIRPAWLAALQAAGIKDFRFHDLRHTAASYLLMSGASLGDIAEVLGHRTLSMVKRYSHVADSHKEEVVAKMIDKFML